MKQYSLHSVNGNAFAVMGYVIQAMKDCNFPKSDQDAYYDEATSGDYSHLLSTSIDYIDKCNIKAALIHDEDDDDEYDED